MFIPNITTIVFHMSCTISRGQCGNQKTLLPRITRVFANYQLCRVGKQKYYETEKHYETDELPKPKANPTQEKLG